MIKRFFIIVLDSVGIGEMPDSASFGDAGSNTLGAIRRSPAFDCPNLEKLGLFNIEGVGGGDLGMTLMETRFAVWLWRGLKIVCKLLGLPGLK